MEGLLVRRSPCRFRLELLEDRLTPSAPGLLGAAAPLHAETLFIDWSSRANVTVLTFNVNYQFSQFAQVDLRIEMPVFSVFEFQGLGNSFGQSSGGLFNGQSTGGPLGNSLQGDSPLAQATSIAPASSSGTSSSQGSSLTHQPASTPSRTQFVLPQMTAPVQNNTNPAATVQVNQVSNPALSFAATPLRLPTTTASGAADSLASESVRIFLPDTGLGSPAINPLAITNPIPTPSPKLTPLPQSGGAGETPPAEEQAKPPVERDMGEQQAQDLFDLFEAGLSAAFVPDSSDEATDALALVGDYGETGPIPTPAPKLTPLPQSGGAGETPPADQTPPPDKP